MSAQFSVLMCFSFLWSFRFSTRRLQEIERNSESQCVQACGCLSRTFVRIAWRLIAVADLMRQEEARVRAWQAICLRPRLLYILLRGGNIIKLVCSAFVYKNIPLCFMFPPIQVNPPFVAPSQCACILLTHCLCPSIPSLSLSCETMYYFTK